MPLASSACNRPSTATGSPAIPTADGPLTDATDRRPSQRDSHLSTSSTVSATDTMLPLPLRRASRTCPPCTRPPPAGLLPTPPPPPRTRPPSLPENVRPPPTVRCHTP